VAEIIAERGLNCRLQRCGVRKTPDGVCGSQDFLHALHGLSSASLVETVLQTLGAART
jgi:transketolase C-terminal domain/subunit